MTIGSSYSSEPVRGHRNQIVVNAARLHRARVRRDLNNTLIEGPHLLQEALVAGVAIEAVFALPDDEKTRRTVEEANLRLTQVDERALSRLADTESPRGPIAIVQIPEARLDVTRDLVVGWGLGVPGNVGTIIRTAAAFGWGYADLAGSVDPWAPKTLRAGAGGQFQTTIGRIAGMDDLSPWHTVASVAREGESPGPVSERPIALLVGEEAAGLPPHVLEMADSRVSIETPGPTESLNAAAATAILLHALSNRGGNSSAPV